MLLSVPTPRDMQRGRTGTLLRALHARPTRPRGLRGPVEQVRWSMPKRLPPSATAECSPTRMLSEYHGAPGLQHRTWFGYTDNLRVCSLNITPSVPVRRLLQHRTCGRPRTNISSRSNPSVRHAPRPCTLSSRATTPRDRPLWRPYVMTSPASRPSDGHGPPSLRDQPTAPQGMPAGFRVRARG